MMRTVILENTSELFGQKAETQASGHPRRLVRERYREHEEGDEIAPEDDGLGDIVRARQAKARADGDPRSERMGGSEDNKDVVGDDTSVNHICRADR